MLDRSQVVQWLAQQTDKQLAEVFYDAVAERPVVDPAEQHYLQGRWVLAQGTKTLADDDQWGDWQLEVIAPHDPAEYPEGWSDDAALCQGGGCCGHEMTSWAKRFRCPLCGNSGFAT